MNHNKLPIMALVFLVLLVAFAGPITWLVHVIHANPNVISALIAILVVGCIAILVLRNHLSGIFQTLRRHMEELEDGEELDFLALEAPRDHTASAIHGQMTTPSTPTNEEVLWLASNCPLPLDSACNHTLILEQPGQRNRSVATRLYVEQFGHWGLRQLILTHNPSYASVLPYLDNGWLAGHPDAQEDRRATLQHHARQCPGLQDHYAPVDEQNASVFGAKLLEAQAQVVLDLSTYADFDQAGRVILEILLGMQAEIVPCIITLTQADQWLPNNQWFQSGHGYLKDERLLKQLRETMLEVMEAPQNTVYLSTDMLMPMDLRLARKCSLWMLNRLPEEDDHPFIAFQTGLSAESFAHLQQVSILADTTTRTAMELALNPAQSAHEEPTRRRSPSGLHFDLSTVAPSEEGVVRLGKPMAGGDDNKNIRQQVAAPPATPQFTWQQYTYALALKQAGHLTQTALRRPPKAKTLWNTGITCLQLAEELGLLAPFSEKELMSGERAEALMTLVEQGLSATEQAQYTAKMQTAISAIAERQNHAQLASAQTLLSRWPLPNVGILHPATDERHDVTKEVRTKAQQLQQLLDGFGLAVRVLEEYISVGPTVIRLGVLPTEKGGRITRVEDIARRRKDIQRVLQATSLRLLDPVPGTPYIGIEIPNPVRSIVRMRTILESREFQFARLESKLTIALGLDITGKIRYFDLRKAPHVLIGGSTGGGKSVCVNSIIVSLLMNCTPEDVRLILVDPKMVELQIYNGVPHLLRPVITDMEAVAPMLQAVQAEMQARYRLFAQHGVRNLEEYQQLCLDNGTLPNIPAQVVLIDELANAMLVAQDEIEPLLCDLIAMGRAAGIHMILATQRPIVDVVTGNIKAQLPTRICFLVPQVSDSRVILDQSGGETLLGKGDGLYLDETLSAPERIQFAFTETAEAKAVVQYWKQAHPLGKDEIAPLHPQEFRQPPLPQEQHYTDTSIPINEGKQEPEQEEQDTLAETLAAFERGKPISLAFSKLDNEALYRFVMVWAKQQSALSIQDVMFRFGLGQARAKRLVLMLEEDGLVGADPGAGKKRPVLTAQATPVESSH